jgi:hypothetical protein
MPATVRESTMLAIWREVADVGTIRTLARSPVVHWSRIASTALVWTLVMIGHGVLQLDRPGIAVALCGQMPSKSVRTSVRSHSLDHRRGVSQQARQRVELIGVHEDVGDDGHGLRGRDQAPQAGPTDEPAMTCRTPTETIGPPTPDVDEKRTGAERVQVCTRARARSRSVDGVDPRWREVESASPAVAARDVPSAFRNR